MKQLSLLLLLNIVPATQMARTDNTDQDADTTSIEDGEAKESYIQTEENQIKTVLQYAKTPEVKAALEKVLKKEKLTAYENHLVGSALLEYNNNPIVCIPFDTLLGKKNIQFEYQTALYNQTDIAKDKLQEMSHNAPRALTIGLFPYVRLFEEKNKYEPVELNAIEEKNIEQELKYNIYGLEQISKFEVTSLDKIFNQNKAFLKVDYTKYITMKLLANNRSSNNVPMIDKINIQPATEADISKHQTLTTTLNDTVKKYMAANEWLQNYEIPCNDLLQMISANDQENKNAFDIRPTENTDIDEHFHSQASLKKYADIIKVILKKLKKGDEQSINKQKLNSKITIKEIKQGHDQGLFKDIDIENLFKHIITVYFAEKIDSKEMKDSITKYQHQTKGKNLDHYTNDQKLRFILDHFAQKPFIHLKKNKNGKLTYQYNEKVSAFYNTVCNLDASTKKIFELINELDTPFHNDFSHLKYFMKLIVDACNKDIHGVKKIMLYDEDKTKLIIEQVYALSLDKLIAKFGKKINVTNNNTVQYSNSRILSNPSCKNYGINKQHTNIKLDGKNFFSIEGIGGAGKTSSAETLMAEILLGRLSGFGFNASMHIPKDFLLRPLLIFKQTHNLLKFPGRGTVSGSQTQTAKQITLDTACKDALDNNWTIFGYNDEVFGSIDIESTLELMNRNENMKSLSSQGRFFVGVIEHDTQKMKMINPQHTISFNTILKSKNDKFYISDDTIKGQIIDPSTDENSNDDFYSALQNILETKEYQSGVTQYIYAEINNEKTELKIINEAEYTRKNKNNLGNVMKFEYLIKSSTNQNQSNATAILAGNCIEIRPLVTQFQYMNTDYLTVIHVKMELENGKPKIVPNGKIFPTATIQSCFTGTEEINYKTINPGEFHHTPLRMYDAICKIFAKSIQNDRSNLVTTAIKDAKTATDHEPLQTIL
jgi:hypothetical protein